MTETCSTNLKLADEKMRAEIARIQSKRYRIDVGTFLVPFLIAACLMGVTGAITKLFL
ncbi:hypothetical protein PhaeoP75_00436 [Phaeobacter gallaeciensis]|uniref:Uncharacterized protein n=1 Tax=Phaeobacter gallaeciensis TaxID=60890 RepID=A0AAC9Z6S9_9RHOB|nr:hypothetical protein Gal_00438 [Phaeobacter gallaeciensis DSM 26640]ATE91497.1 hypothetical protein PhaeoP11_00435 [Phaeobacter gallaeciensis]ATE95773.1 hypothetical protein PhaeoP73_00436 [Phaeobacter gallaeciensis]ATF00113.1 hypothetical protein PhaeoP75_00436 [Phaeobacter gallaeciensis]ATF04545.1 hypothetical protein PhaeoP63_00436 [Phaeobacter gallaeciensis]